MAVNRGCVIGVQMVDLPADCEGLRWIASRDPTRLLLLPGLQPSSIVAAAAGDQQALAYVCYKTQHPAGDASTSVLNPLETACVAASKVTGRAAYKIFLKTLYKKDPRLARVFESRQLNTRELLDEAATEGELSAMKWTRAICPRTFKSESRHMMMYAAGNGHLEVLKYLRSGPSPAAWDPETARIAARRLNCLKWLLSTDAPGGPCPCDQSILKSIASRHGLSALQWFRANGKLPAEFWNENLLVTAVQLGDQPMVEWLIMQAIPWSKQVTHAAARKSLSMLQWLRVQDPPCPWDVDWCTAAAVGAGKLDILVWLRGQDPCCPWPAECADLAAQLPTPEVLQWLYNHKCPFGLTTASRAAQRGNLAMLQWLHSAGCPMTSKCSTSRQCASPAVAV